MFNGQNIQIKTLNIRMANCIQFNKVFICWYVLALGQTVKLYTCYALAAAASATAAAVVATVIAVVTN